MLLFHLFQTGDVHDFFTLTAQKHLRGHDKKLTLPHCRTRIRHNFFTLRVIGTWNALPEEIVHSPSKTTFKRLLDSYFGLKPKRSLLFSFFSFFFFFIFFPFQIFPHKKNRKMKKN